MLRKSLHFALVTLCFLGGCGSANSGPTVAEICQKSSDILKEHTGSGFTDGGMAGCVHLGAVEAARQQEALKEMIKTAN